MAERGEKFLWKLLNKPSVQALYVVLVIGGGYSAYQDLDQNTSKNAPIAALAFAALTIVSVTLPAVAV